MVQAKRDGLDLMVAIFDEFGERGAFGAGRIGECDNRALRGKRRDRERQVFDHLAPDIENVRAGGFALEIFLGRALIDLPRQKRGRDPVGVQNADDKEMWGANGFPPQRYQAPMRNFVCRAW